MNLDSGFFTPKTATLQPEVEFFMRQLQEAAQFVSGAFPSVYGGPQKGGSGTASEYEMSRNQALQRLSILWKMVNIWWPGVMTLGFKSLKKNLTYDESFVKKEGDGFVNVWIRIAEMEGEIAEIEPEVSEGFPASWAQKRQALGELMAMDNPAIQGTLFHPNNMNFMFDTIGLEDLKIPGKADRDKQLLEITLLVKGRPNPDGSPTIPVDVDLDDHDIHGQACREWLISDAGTAARVDNPLGFQNVVIHMRAHAMMKQQQMMQQQMQNPQGQGQETAEPSVEISGETNG
jgi:hypothetical protein